MSVVEDYTMAWSSDSKRIILSPSVFAKNTLFYAQELGEFHTNQDYYTYRKNLDSFLIVLTLDGEGQLEYQGDKTTLRENDLFFIDCSKPHKYACISKNWDFLWIHINGNSIGGYYAQYLKNNPHSVLSLVNRSTAENLFNELISANETPTESNELVTSALICNLLTELLLQNFKSYTHPQQYPEFLKQVLDDIDRNFCDDLRLDDFAEKYNVNMFHLSKEFKKYLGINFKSYILTRRMAKAKDLLMYSSLSIAEIADIVGFESASHFISLFKQKENTTPLAYRHLWG